MLVILGLLTGGILAGQSLIRAAELRGVVSDYTRFVTAAQTFRDKYFMLPGDLNNATKFWGAQHATPATCAVTPSTSALTCDGDGNGMICDGSTCTVGVTTSNESFRFWQHLANAGLIEGTYDGITHGTTGYSATNENSPEGKMGGTIWFIWNWGYLQDGSTDFFAGSYGNRLSVGNVRVDLGPGPNIFKPEEVWNVDTKLDDGRPAIGKVRTRWNNNCTDAVVGTNLNANYSLSNTSKICNMDFPDAF